jgi:hypothetical protein
VSAFDSTPGHLLEQAQLTTPVNNKSETGIGTWVEPLTAAGQPTVGGREALFRIMWFVDFDVDVAGTTPCVRH